MIENVRRMENKSSRLHYFFNRKWKILEEIRKILEENRRRKKRIEEERRE